MHPTRPTTLGAAALLLALATPALAAPATACAVAPTLADVKSALGGPALDAVGTFRARLSLQRGPVPDGSDAIDVADHVLEPKTGRLRVERPGSIQWWDGATGWAVAGSELQLLSETAAQRLHDASAYHFLTLLADPATAAAAAGPHRLRVTPKARAPFSLRLDPGDCRIRELDFGNGTTGTEGDERDVAGIRWPHRFTLRSADGTLTHGTFSEVAVEASGTLPAPMVAAAAARVLPEPSAPVAVLAGAGWLSTEGNDYNLSMNAAGDTLVFATSEAGFARSRILVASKGADGRWSAPAPLAFTDARYRDSDPWLTPDGEWLYFVSDRPPQGEGPAQKHLDIWRVRRLPAPGTPEHLPALASAGYELGPEVHDGWIYFNSTRRGGPAPMSIWRAPLTSDGFGAPEPLPSPFNAGRTQGDFTLSPDGRTALFWRAGEDNDGDLLAARRTAGGWSAPVRLPAPLSGKAFDFTPAFSADGRWVSFASERRFEGGGPALLNGLANVYVAPRSLVESALDAAGTGR